MDAQVKASLQYDRRSIVQISYILEERLVDCILPVG